MAEILQAHGTRLTARPPMAMIQIRADLATAGAALTEATGLWVPPPLTVNAHGARRVLWMAPDELLLTAPQEEAAPLVSALGAAFGAAHHLVLDVSDARVAFGLEGGMAREVLAKLFPIDLHPSAFPAWHVRRSRAAQVAAAVWAEPEEVFTLICFRSVGSYMARALEQSLQDGPVGVF